MIGGEFTGGRPHGGQQLTGGRRRHRHRKSKKGKKSKRGGSVISTAIVPFGLLALQRYFKGSKTTKAGVKNMGNSFKRTFRRRH